MAVAFHNLGMLKMDQEDLQQAQTLIAEAVTIHRALWKQHAEAYGDNLAQSLAAEITILQRKVEAVTLICERLDEMANVAWTDYLKQWAKEHMIKMCNREQ